MFGKPGIPIDYYGKHRVYHICGPMTGHLDYNRPVFNLVAAELRAQGLPSVHNPAEYPDDLEQLNALLQGCGFALRLPEGEPLSPEERHSILWHAYMTLSLNAMRRVRAIGALILLPGWFTSHGARLERETAIHYRWPIIDVIEVFDPVARKKIYPHPSPESHPSHLSIEEGGPSCASS